MIRSAWHKQADGKLRLAVTIPANTTADILLPSAMDESRATESGRPLQEAAGIESVQATGQGILVTVGSGSYTFEIERAE
ncbi:hypothetical protein D3C77_350150 [compost metagenome]